VPVADRFRWVRIDDRLLHGQVALGWRGALDPLAFLIVDDHAAGDAFAAMIFQGALPEGTELVLRGVDAFLADQHVPCVPERTVLLLRDIETMERLWRGGFRPGEANLGGLHEKPGARRFLDYLYLTDVEIGILRDLMDGGLVLFAQDLPHSARRPLESILGDASENSGTNPGG
jgi:mannose/fructose/N-acetylgalactosamine-specific phosphotransferase system component IIB